MAKISPLDCAAQVDLICERLHRSATQTYQRRGFVVAISGGIDSSVCAALVTRAIGASRVHALMLPERASSSYSTHAAEALVSKLGIACERQDISPTLEAIGCYRAQTEALQTAIQGFQPDWKFKLAISNTMGGRIGITRVIAQTAEGQIIEQRLSAAAYLKLVAATNFKQRIRKTLEYYHADRLNYLVVGTPNLLEYELGFFVKNGDGSADVKPIAHLYKTQVYELARYLDLPQLILESTPTTDTFTLPQGQDEFYFGLPYAQMDVALWHVLHDYPAQELAVELGVKYEHALQIYEGIRAKQRATRYLLEQPKPVHYMTDSE